MADEVQGRRLGRQPYRHDDRTFKLHRYLDPKALPPTPRMKKLDPMVKNWPMYANDRIGDCTAAAVGHATQLWTALGHTEVDPTEANVIAMYSAITGYDPAQTDRSGNNPTDQGAVMLDVMRYWRKVGLEGHKIGAFAEVDPSNHGMVKDALYIFEGLNIGVDLPNTAQLQGDYWYRVRDYQTNPNAAPGSWGGHDIWVVDYDQWWLTAVSWGELVHMSWAFWDQYVSECWVAISTDYLRGDKTIEGFDVQTLNADLQQIGRVA